MNSNDGAAGSETAPKRRKGIHIALHWQILIGIALGAAYGIFLPHWTQYIEWIGDLFLNALNMIVIPLIASSIFIGVAGMAGGNLGRVLGKTLSYYLLTTLTAVIIGLVLVSVIRPGVGRDVVLTGNVENIAAQDVHMIDQLTGIVPSNVFAAMADGNILPIIFFMVLLGIFSTKLDKKHYTVLLDFFTAVYELIMKVTMAIIRLTPIGIFSVMACMIGKQAGDPDALIGIVKGLGMFVLTVWAGCLIHGGLVLPGTVWALARINPYKHMRRVSTPMLTAFTTCSSNATLPLSIRYSQACGVSEKLAGLTLSLGSTVNMNGTALFECVSALFIAQLYGIDLTIGQQITVVLTSLMAAVGSAGIPMAGIVMMAIVFNAVGLPMEGVGIILAVQQICEMPRTCLNVYGDLCGAVIVARSEGDRITV